MLNSLSQPSNLHPFGPAPLIQMTTVDKTFKTQAGEFQVLKGVSANFFPGEFVSIIGKSGSGKSTLINMITGIDHPTAGSIKVEDVFIHKMPESKMAVWRGNNLGIVFQFFQLLPMLSVVENVMLPMDFCARYPVSGREQKAMELLAMVGLEDFAGQLPAELSGGQQQTAAVARALANDPPIIIADEPTGNLDSNTAEVVFAIFAGLIARGKTILMVTHDQNLAKRTSRSLLLCDGELVNEKVFNSFPHLPHRDLLWLSHQFKLETFSPGEDLLSNRALLSGLYLVSQGVLEIFPEPSPRSFGSPIARLGPGEYISSRQMNTSSPGPFLLRAGQTSPLEIFTLSEAALENWLPASPPAQSLFFKSKPWPEITSADTEGKA